MKSCAKTVQTPDDLGGHRRRALQRSMCGDFNESQNIIALVLTDERNAAHLLILSTTIFADEVGQWPAAARTFEVGHQGVSPPAFAGIGKIINRSGSKVQALRPRQPPKPRALGSGAADLVGSAAHR